MEGWHGVRFAKPVRRTRETIDIIRAVTAGHRLEYDGEIYQLPLAGGEGRAIRSLMSPTHVPIYVASLGPANLRLTGELADGWIGNSFFPETAEVFLDPIRDGASRAGRSFADLDLTVAVGVGSPAVSPPAAATPRNAFTFGTMGSTCNFYNDASPAGLWRRRSGRAAAVAGRRRPGGRAAGCPPPSDSAPTSSALTPSTIGSRLYRRRHHHARAQLQGDPAHACRANSTTSPTSSTRPRRQRASRHRHPRRRRAHDHRHRRPRATR
jgi:alkanesulfonate monooxygenase SsuD/methylene tetrahydromethanopterin reductase-like flavin-dependent oxidoreductase (luciferase family)